MLVILLVTVSSGIILLLIWTFTSTWLEKANFHSVNSWYIETIMKQNNNIFANILLMIYLRLRGYLVLECYVNFALKSQVSSCCILLNYLLLIKRQQNHVHNICFCCAAYRAVAWSKWCYRWESLVSLGVGQVARSPRVENSDTP